MAEMIPIKLTVVSHKGTCVAQHKVGDEFLCDGLTPQGVCVEAFHALYPSLWTMIMGGSFPWADEDGALRIVCPDANNPVLFELRRAEPGE